MECEETRFDMREDHPELLAELLRTKEVMKRWKQTEPFTEEYNACMKEYFGENIGDGSMVCLPVSGACISDTKIGKNVFVNANVLIMGRGGITLEDGVMIAENAQLISNNHDPYDLQVLTLKPVLIREGAWIGAGATVLPGVCVGKHAVIGAASVVTKDVPDFAVAVGNPAKVIKYLDKEKFDTK